MSSKRTSKFPFSCHSTFQNLVLQESTNLIFALLLTSSHMLLIDLQIHSIRCRHFFGNPHSFPLIFGTYYPFPQRLIIIGKLPQPLYFESLTLHLQVIYPRTTYLLASYHYFPLHQMEAFPHLVVMPQEFPNIVQSLW